MDFAKLNIGRQAREALSAAVDGGLLSHAVLLTGGDGELRKKTARRVAAALLCGGAGQRPCGKCPACVKTKAGTHPDLFETEGGDKPKSIKIDAVRALRRQAFLVPNEAACKVFLILEASGMGDEAQNALLKLIEDPPPFTRFILACASKEHLLPTVRSRVTAYSLGGGGRGKMAAKTAGKLDVALGNLVSALVSGSEYDLILATAPLEKDRALFQKCVEALIELLRDALRHGDGGERLSENAVAAAQAAVLGKPTLFRHIEALKALREDAEKNANENLLLARLAAELGKR